MSDLDQRLTATLRARAGTEADLAPIVARARRQGRRHQIRRRGLLGLGAAAAATALATVFLLPPAPRPGAVLLPAATQPGAADRPGLLGTDPWTLHFTAEALVAGAEYVTWKAGAGIESVQYSGPAGQGRLLLTADRDRLASIKQALTSTSSPEFEPREEQVQVGVRPATAWYEPNDPGDDLWFVRWQPVDGVWARLEIYASGRAQAVAAAERARFDAARRCVVPFRLTVLPAGSRVISCSVQLGDGFVEGALVVGDDAQRWMTVRAQRTAGRGSSEVRVQSPGILERFVRPVAVEAFADGSLGHNYSEDDARTVLAGYDQLDDLDDPAKW